MSDAKTEITLAGDWSRPASVLIEKIADAVGGIGRPHQIVRVAKADAKATIIRARAEIEVKNLERRAMRRFVAEEAKKQANMEQIIRDSLPQLTENSRPQDLPDDWISNFFEKCRIISDEDMQRLWAKILAGEANAPGSYSRKTVNLLADLERTDALLFTKLCGFMWTLFDPEPISCPFVTDARAPIYRNQGIHFETLSHLGSLGLVQFDTGGFYRTELLSPLQLNYFGRTVTLSIPQPPANSMPMGQVLLTRAGGELARACSSAHVEGFFEFVCGLWRNAAYLANIAEPVVEPLLGQQLSERSKD
jgi:hypothetical protein